MPLQHLIGKAEKCPICTGTGKANNRECHGCEGKGWVTVYDKIITDFVFARGGKN